LLGRLLDKYQAEFNENGLVLPVGRARVAGLIASAGQPREHSRSAGSPDMPLQIAAA
jgi:hypothetical protein